MKGPSFLHGYLGRPIVCDQPRQEGNATVFCRPETCDLFMLHRGPCRCVGKFELGWIDFLLLSINSLVVKKGYIASHLSRRLGLLSSAVYYMSNHKAIKSVPPDSMVGIGDLRDMCRIFHRNDRRDP